MGRENTQFSLRKRYVELDIKKWLTERATTKKKKKRIPIEKKIIIFSWRDEGAVGGGVVV